MASSNSKSSPQPAQNKGTTTRPPNGVKVFLDTMRLADHDAIKKECEAILIRKISPENAVYLAQNAPSVNALVWFPRHLTLSRTDNLPLYDKSNSVLSSFQALEEKAINYILDNDVLDKRMTATEMSNFLGLDLFERLGIAVISRMMLQNMRQRMKMRGGKGFQWYVIHCFKMLSKNFLFLRIIHSLSRSNEILLNFHIIHATLNSVEPQLIKISNWSSSSSKSLINKYRILFFNV